MSSLLFRRGPTPARQTPTFSPIPREIPGIPRLTAPGLAAVVVLAVVFLATSLHRLNHTDLWGHLNFGRWIAEHGTLPTTDPFREVGIARAFVNQPWLSQWAGFQIFRVFGYDGLAITHALLLTLTCGAIMLAIRARGVSAGGAVAGGAVAFVLSLPLIGTLRPQLGGELAFALTLLGGTLLLRSWRPLVWLPVVFTIWANLHGSAPTGLLVLGSFWLSAAIQAVWSTHRLRGITSDGVVRRLTMAFVLCVLATCLNPSGPRLLVESAVFAGNANLQAITEWQPLTIKSLTGVIFFASVILTVLVLRRSPRRVEWWEGLLLLALGLATLGAIRMLAWWALAWPWLMGPHLTAVVRRRRPDERATNDPTTFRTLVAVAVVFAALVWSPAMQGLVAGHPRTEANAVNAQTPMFIAQAIQDEQLAGAMYAPLDWADYLVWKTNGAVRPLVHSHVHLATAGAFTDYRRLAAGDAAWLDIADYYKLRYLVVRNEQGRGLEKLVTGSRRCRVLYRDQQGLIAEILPAPKAGEHVSKNEHPAAGPVALFQH